MDGWMEDRWKTSDSSTELGGGVEVDEPEVKHLYQDHLCRCHWRCLLMRLCNLVIYRLFLLDWNDCVLS